MSQVQREVGRAVARWDETDPLFWTMEDDDGTERPAVDVIECDLRMLRLHCTEDFLLALKDRIIDSRHQLQLPSIASAVMAIRRILELVHVGSYVQESRIGIIDATFLAALFVTETIPISYYGFLKRLYKTNSHDLRLFSSGLLLSDFENKGSKRGIYGDRIDRILSRAFQKATLVHILDTAEQAFEEGNLDLGRYAFLKLSLNIFCRPESYRQLRLGDLIVDTAPESGLKTHFLRVAPAKSGTHNPEKLVYSLHPDVGNLLEMQRESVVKVYGHINLDEEAQGHSHKDLALFPALHLSKDKTGWRSEYANARNGQLRNREILVVYLRKVRELSGQKITFNALRHTIGTQLAMTGCSAQTIQAVLKHAGKQTADAYVDIAFSGLIDKLSEGLEPAFDDHFPIAKFVSKTSEMPEDRKIESEDIDSGGAIETTGLCGRRIACSYAPITCYSCHKFIPCYDADHNINLAIVDREIGAASGKGLAMEHEVRRWKTIRNHINIVIVASQQMQRAEKFTSEGGTSDV